MNLVLVLMGTQRRTHRLGQQTAWKSISETWRVPASRRREILFNDEWKWINRWWLQRRLICLAVKYLNNNPHFALHVVVILCSATGGSTPKSYIWALSLLNNIMAQKVQTSFTLSLLPKLRSNSATYVSALPSQGDVKTSHQIKAKNMLIRREPEMSQVFFFSSVIETWIYPVSCSAP